MYQKFVNVRKIKIVFRFLQQNKGKRLEVFFLYGTVTLRKKYASYKTHFKMNLKNAFKENGF